MTGGKACLWPIPINSSKSMISELYHFMNKCAMYTNNSIIYKLVAPFVRDMSKNLFSSDYLEKPNISKIIKQKNKDLKLVFQYLSDA